MNLSSLLIIVFANIMTAQAAPHKNIIQGDLQSLAELHQDNLPILNQTLEESGFDWNHVKYSSLERAIIHEGSVDYLFRLGAGRATGEDNNPLICKKLLKLSVAKGNKKIIAASVENGRCYKLNLSQD